MQILKNLKRLESRLTTTLEEAAERVSPKGELEPLEILHEIVRAVEKQIEPAGRGKYVFPFNRITISIVAASRETRARFEAVLGSEPSLQQRIVLQLQAAGCDCSGLNIEERYVECGEPGWMSSNFHIEFERVVDLDSGDRHSLRITVIRGTAEKSEYVMTTLRINLGRCPEVRDSRNRLIRTNHMAFVESPVEENQTVSRTHAHIERGGDSGEYRLHDDRSAHGTTVLRNGHTIAVPPGSRGVRLQSGDEIQLGEACVRVEIVKLDDPRLTL
jgi:hypothetical protein